MESRDLDERMFFPPNESSVAALGASLVTKQRKMQQINRIGLRDHVESIDLDERIFVPPSESSVAALGASLVTKQAGRVPQHD